MRKARSKHSKLHGDGEVKRRTRIRLLRFFCCGIYATITRPSPIFIERMSVIVLGTDCTYLVLVLSHPKMSETA